MCDWALCCEVNGVGAVGGCASSDSLCGDAGDWIPVLFRRLPSGTILVDVAKPTGEERVVCMPGCRLLTSGPTWIGRYRS
jgi:hypothetical protein